MPSREWARGTAIAGSRQRWMCERRAAAGRTARQRADRGGQAGSDQLQLLDLPVLGGARLCTGGGLSQHSAQAAESPGLGTRRFGGQAPPVNRKWIAARGTNRAGPTWNRHQGGQNSLLVYDSCLRATTSDFGTDNSVFGSTDR